ncbi:MAG: hypothetical protein ATN35_01015 [Epulopiscium sp. Nele67-Bin004]|nr:MAG: hypothetical protein ATN35_01015 [Epulopiscium sp. Nele67-Bin004]
MQKIDIICLSKIKEKHYIDAVLEYKKRLTTYCKLQVTETSDTKVKIPPKAFVVALTLDGKHITSEELASFIATKAVDGHSHLVFLIGDSDGLPPDLIERANFKLCFSKMTFPHQLFRVMLIEQIYRAHKINANEVYHK